jgi:hypothetical protein
MEGKRASDFIVPVLQKVHGCLSGRHAVSSRDAGFSLREQRSDAL